MHKVFISYHHDNDQEYKDKLVNAAQKYNIFIDVSVDTGEISDNLEMNPYGNKSGMCIYRIPL